MRTLSFADSAATLFTAHGSDLYVAVIRADHADVVTVERVSSRTGGVSSAPLPFPLAGFLADIAVGPEGFYLGTSVIRRFTRTPDVLVRLDPSTLKQTARASFAANVHAYTQGRQLWASLGDGRVVRLDPHTLAIKASAQILPRSAALRGEGLVSAPALGLGSLWALAGDERDLQLVRMDPSTLAVRSKTAVPTRGNYYQSLNSVTADANHVFLTGRGLARVDVDGQLTGPPMVDSGLAAAAQHGSGLLALTDPPTTLELLNGDGHVQARSPLIDAGGSLAVSGDTAWLLGNAGHGDGIVQIRLRRPA
ncbi:MAG: hypothetical protein ACRDWT_06265 [Jatrophihabitantaceae bacterium]